MRLLPRKVTILSQTVRIRRTSYLKVTIADKAEDCWGAFEESGPFIEIDRTPSRTMGGDKLRTVFTHECIHAMFGVSGIVSMFSKDEIEERFTKLFAPVLLAFLRDNPIAVEFLQEKDNA